METAYLEDISVIPYVKHPSDRNKDLVYLQELRYYGDIDYGDASLLDADLFLHKMIDHDPGTINLAIMID